ncbi:hypothetical protein BDZ91DRAFT_719177 [Kalaharituber pfeilii]|nr:hypothetical protein BDZ91DRAFT_719177 [Kalaharituber pfeilii]
MNKSIRSLVITLESFRSAEIETQASLLPVSSSPRSQVIRLPLIECSEPSPVTESRPPTVNIALISQLDDLPCSTKAYILSLKERWLERLGLCIDILTQNPTVDSQCPAFEEKVVFMLGGITGMRFACVKKIAEDVTGGDIKLAERIFSMVEKGTSKCASARKMDDSTPKNLSQADKSPPPKGAGAHYYSSALSPISSDVRSTPDSTPVYGATGRPPTPAMDRRDSRSRTASLAESYATASSYPSDDGPPILISQSLTLDFRQGEDPLQNQSSSDGSILASVCRRPSIRRHTSMIHLPPSADTNFDCRSSAILQNRPSLNDIRRKASISSGTSWYGSREIKLEDSTLATLVERSLSIKHATRYGDNSEGNSQQTQSKHEGTEGGQKKDFSDQFGKLLPLSNTTPARDGSVRVNSSFLQLGTSAEDDSPESPVSTEARETIPLECQPSILKVDIRSSWLAPPTAGGELRPMLELNEDVGKRKYWEDEFEELFPTLRSRLQKLQNTELSSKNLYAGLLYLDTDKPDICAERSVYEHLFQASIKDKEETFYGSQSWYRRVSEARTMDASSPEPIPWRLYPGNAESTAVYSIPSQVREIDISAEKKKNAIQIQNEARSFIRDLSEAAAENRFHLKDGSIFEEEDEGIGESNEDDPTIWRDMFSTQGEWPLSTVNLMVALGREGPTNTVKGGSGRVIAEAMARRLEGWDLRCRRISVRYLINLAKRGVVGHLGLATFKSLPRQLVAELECFLSQHEPTDVLILEFNINNREETEAVLELSKTLGHASQQPLSGPESTTVLRMACVFSGEVPRDLDVHGVVVGNSCEFITSNTRVEPTPFEGFRFPTCRESDSDKPKNRSLAAWVKELITVADLVVEDTNTDKESRRQRYQNMPLESQLEIVFNILDHWTAVARLRPASIFEASRPSSNTSAQSRPIASPTSSTTRLAEAQMKQQERESTPPKPARTQNRTRSRTLLGVIVTAFTEGDGEDIGNQNYKPLTTCREVFCQSPSSGGTFLEDAAEEDSSDDDFDLGINGFEPSIGIVDAHEQSDADDCEDIAEDASVEDYDMVVAMQYMTPYSMPRNTRKLSKKRRKKTQIWFRSKKPADIEQREGAPPVKRMKIMRISGAGPPGSIIHGRGKSKDMKGQLGVVLVSNKAMKLLGLERSIEEMSSA